MPIRFPSTPTTISVWNAVSTIYRSVKGDRNTWRRVIVSAMENGELTCFDEMGIRRSYSASRPYSASLLKFKEDGGIEDVVIPQWLLRTAELVEWLKKNTTFEVELTSAPTILDKTAPSTTAPAPVVESPTDKAIERPVPAPSAEVPRSGASENTSKWPKTGKIMSTFGAKFNASTHTNIDGRLRKADSYSKLSKARELVKFPGGRVLARWYPPGVADYLVTENFITPDYARIVIENEFSEFCDEARLLPWFNSSVIS